MTTDDRPLRVYVDTNVLSAVAKGELPAIEQAAFDAVAALVRSSAVTLLSSPVTLEEMNLIPPAHRGPHIFQYDAVAKVSSEITWYELDPAIEMLDEVEDPVFIELRDFLPDENDARHLAHAKLEGIDHTLTLDRRTILRYAPQLRDRFGMMVYKPSEFISWFSARG